MIKKENEKGLRRKYIANSVFVLFVGWIHILFGIVGYILLFQKDEGVIKLLLTYMILLGVVILQYYKYAKKSAVKTGNLEQEIIKLKTEIKTL